MGELSSWLISTYDPEDIQELIADFSEINTRFPEPLITLLQLPPLPRLAYLSLRGHALHTIEGVARFPSIETCILSDNELETAHFGLENPALRDIDISDNPLHLLNFSHGHPVCELDISRTRITTFPNLFGCTNLERLTANGLYIKSIGTQALPESLRKLHMRNARLALDDWPYLPEGLQELRIGADGFSDSAQQRFHDLRSCSLHQLTQPVHLNMPHLETASLDWFESRIQLTFGELPKLHTLRLPGCVPEKLPDLTRVENLSTVYCRCVGEDLPSLRQRFPNISTWKPI